MRFHGKEGKFSRSPREKEFLQLKEKKEKNTNAFLLVYRDSLQKITNSSFL